MQLLDDQQLKPKRKIMKIGIADPQLRVRFSLRVLLEQQPGWIVAGEAADSVELIEILCRGSPDLLLLDWDLPSLLPDPLLRCLKTQYPELKIIMMSGRQELQQTALQAGADAFASKADSPEKLLALIRGLCD
jgi:DNA-binding NarL/FixJ family response regulator